MKTSLIASILALSVVLIGCTRDRAHRKDPERVASFLNSKLDLSQKQNELLKTLMSEMKRMEDKAETERTRAKREFSFLLQSETFSESRARSIISEVEKSYTSEVDSILPLVSEFHESLTAEQRNRIGKIIQEHEEN